jgi:hypothetical protein
MAKQKLEQMALPGFQMTLSENSEKNAAQLAALEALQTGLVVIQTCFENLSRLLETQASPLCADTQGIGERILSELSEMMQQNRSMCVQLKKLIQLCKTSSSSTGDSEEDPFGGMGDFSL